mgnify:CR=1 FL=1
MTPWKAGHWTAQPHGAAIQLNQHGQMQVRFLSDSMARVTVKPKDGFREPKTWSISPCASKQNLDVPWQGRDREDDPVDEQGGDRDEDADDGQHLHDAGHDAGRLGIIVTLCFSPGVTFVTAHFDRTPRSRRPGSEYGAHRSA